ncbi:hypothetical protein GCM10009787_33080 [Streptomyces bangladeshensis]|uniref:Uncharacterized protein n=1 Tax=Streptomyces bangladeshensis TaxID=295352 RepID=A0ABN3BJ87_9ACTN
MRRPRCSAITFAVAGPSTDFRGCFRGSSSAGTRSIAHHGTDNAVDAAEGGPPEAPKMIPSEAL